MVIPVAIPARSVAASPAERIFGVRLSAWAIVLCGVALAGDYAAFTPGLLRYVSERWGRDAPERLADWKRGVEKHDLGRPPSDSETMRELEEFNGYWNRVRYYTDARHWGVTDYWATPVETLASEGADCEDYAIGKYFSLKAMGIPVQSLRITYVRAVRWNQAHMVLAYYPESSSDPFILDNLNRGVSRASERPDLIPVYSFNGEDLWLPGVSEAGGKSNQIRLWRDLQDKMEKERTM